MVKIGIRLRYIRGDVKAVAAIAEEADRLGYESLWLPDRLIMPVNLDERLDDVHASLGTPITLRDPAFDDFAYLAFLAARTRFLHLGTSVWQIGLRHPFSAARAIQTLDILSDGRAEIGVGAGWLSSEYEAVGVDFASRGRRADEIIAICQRLWSEDVVEHHGEFFSFGPVMFEPKPVQKPWPRMHAGGEGPPSIRRAARLDGWIGRSHTPETVAPFVERLHRLRAAEPARDRPFDVTIRVPVDEVGDLDRWESVGVTRLYLCPWEKGEDPIVGLRRFAARYELVPPA
jgi:probable F420-dependent oxidoreductase